MIRASLVVLVLFFILPYSSTGALMECPGDSVTMTGTASDGMGTVYTQSLSAWKVSGGAGYNGRWKVTAFQQIITYPWDLRFTYQMNQPVDLGGGYIVDATCAMTGNSIRCSGISDKMYLDVSGGRVRAEGVDQWNGKVTGNVMSFKYDLESPLEPVMTGTIGQGMKESVEMTIRKPEDKKRYVYGEGLDRLVMELEATTNPEHYADSVEWTIPEIKGSERTIIPAGSSSTLKGRRITVVYKGLPEHNDEFGKKKVTATLSLGACAARETREVQFFYPRDAKNNPGGEYYNWFYYWKQTPAARPFGQSVNLAFGGTEFDLCTGPHVIAIFKPDYLFKAIHVCDLTKKLGSDFVLAIPKVSRAQSSTLTAKQLVTYNHIDTFAVLVMHEFSHFNHHHTWWSGKSTAQREAEDADRDGVPDRLEPEMGFRSDKYQTYWGEDPEFKDINGDEEFLAYESTYGFKPGEYNKYDWGKPGKNWP